MLANLKTGGLFSYRCDDSAPILEAAKTLDTQLASKGLRLVPLKASPRHVLFYLYRSSALHADLTSPDIAGALHDFGYPCPHLHACIAHLSERVQGSDEFPHEVGLFLGYPCDDVLQFIQHKGKNSACAGYWKVYTDPDRAQQRFLDFRRCNETYGRRFQQGSRISQLALAG